MAELIPIGTGLAAGVCAAWFDARTIRLACLAVIVAAAFAAAQVSGELAESPLFILWDLFQGLVAALVGFWVATRARARTAS